MNGRKEANVLKVPAPVAEIWRRLESGTGSRSDLESIVAFLAKIWAFEPDPFDRWLAENHHVERQYLSPADQVEYKRQFEREQAEKEILTRDIVRHVLNGPYLLPLIEFTDAFSEELKLIVYKMALDDPCT